jgi:hypothetical protein
VQQQVAELSARPDDGAVALSTDPAVLHALDGEAVRLAVWRRTLPHALAEWLDCLCFPMPRQGRWQLHPQMELPATVQAWLSGWLAGIDQPAPAWCDDITTLLAQIRREFPDRSFAVRLDVVANDGCRLFHVDRLLARWVCTYRGPGTEWLPDAAVDRSRMHRGNNDHVLDWSAVRRLERGWVAALKGGLWASGCDTGLVHRSPPASPAQPRIVLAVDPLAH